MTKTIKSQTKIDGYYFITVDDESGQACDCTCSDHYYRGRQCKHMTSFNAEVARALVFNRLVAQFDVRSEAARAADAQVGDSYEHLVQTCTVCGRNAVATICGRCIGW